MYRIELVTDAGLPSEDRQVRVFGIRDANGLLFPSFGLVADPLANLADLSDAQKLLAFIQANELNEPTAKYPNGNPFGYQAELDTILRAGAGGGGGGGTLVFEWNQTDVSQFDLGTVYNAGGSIGAPTLTVVPDSNVIGGNVLRMSASGVGEGYAVILANDALPSKHYRLIAEINAVGTNGQGFVMFAEDSAGLFAYGTTTIGTARYWRIDAGVASVFGSTGVTTMVASGRGIVDMEVRAEKPSGAGVRGSWYQNGQYSAFATPRASMRGIRQDYPGEPAPASWNALTANRWGLALYGAGGGATGPLDIASLKIFDLS
ncbi:MAG TPA: hypothetical protein ENK57_12260 [Polyangiaceae bacterium]|nr:hypothetical protein [Polyangiaceae bacterium]